MVDEVETKIKEYIPLAMSISKEYPMMDLDECFSAALGGLWEAAQKFKPESGVPFGALAANTIRFRIKDLQRTVWGRCYPDGRKYGGRFKGQDIKLIPIHECYIDDGKRPLAEVVPDNLDTPSDDCLKEEMARVVKSVLQQIDERERYTIEAIFHMNGCQEESQIELVEKFGCTEGRVSQIKQEALKKLRPKLKKYYEHRD